MEYRLRKLAQCVRGWMGSFGISDYYYRPVSELDHWRHRRMRMCYWKRWRYVRTKVRNLLARRTIILQLKCRISGKTPSSTKSISGESFKSQNQGNGSQKSYCDPIDPGVVQGV